MYDITVVTLINHGGRREAADQITFYSVGDHVRELIAESCRVTLMKLLRQPEDRSPDAWNLQYRTLVRDHNTGETLRDTKLITFPGMSREQIVEFQKWAVQQLSETIDAIDLERSGHDKPVLHKRSATMTLLRLAWDIARQSWKERG